MYSIFYKISNPPPSRPPIIESKLLISKQQLQEESMTIKWGCDMQV